MDMVAVSGWVAAGFTLSAFSMRTMLPLRLSALGASTFFIIYGWFSPAWPVLALHSVLLPFNAWRLVEILRIDREARKARAGDFSLDWIRYVTRPKPLNDGEYVFRKGDAPDAMYYIAKGRILLEEIGVTLEEGEIFGEIAFFTNTRERTLSARAQGDCRILFLNERDFMRLYGQNPAFSLYVMRLVTSRLMDGIAQKPEAYAPRSEQDPDVQNSADLAAAP